MKLNFAIAMINLANLPQKLIHQLAKINAAL